MTRQDYQTPRALLDAVEDRFGRLTFDLAADELNRAAPHFYGVEQDALAQDWTALRGNLWLNPPYADIRPWAAKCAASRGDGRRIFLLTPASIDSNWFADHVVRNALVIGVNPRVTFVGCSAPYPKPLMLSVIGPWVGFDVWRWKP